MCVESFNLFLHYKQGKHFRVLMEMNVQMYSSSFVALYKTYVNFLYIFAKIFGFPNKNDKTMGLLVNALLERSSA